MLEVEYVPYAWEPVRMTDSMVYDEMVTSLEVGRKSDSEKPRMDLLDSDWLEEVAWVMTFGMEKYDAHNWRGGLGVSRLLAATLRHVFSALKGEDKDPESGRSHLAHASCCLMFAFWMLKYKPELDDRYKY